MIVKRYIKVRASQFKVGDVYLDKYVCVKSYGTRGVFLSTRPVATLAYSTDDESVNYMNDYYTASIRKKLPRPDGNIVIGVDCLEEVYLPSAGDIASLPDDIAESLRITTPVWLRDGMAMNANWDIFETSHRDELDVLVMFVLEVD